MRYFFLLIALLSSITSFSQDELKSDILVRFADKVDAYQYMSIRQAKSRSSLVFNIKRPISKIFNIYSIEYKGSKIEGDQIINTLQKDQKYVLSAAYDTPLEYRDKIPNDELFNEQWNLDRIQIPKVWDETTGGKTANGDEIVIAVLEKGLNINHPDLIDNIWRNNQEIPDNGIDDDNNGYIDDYWGLNLESFTDNHPPLLHGTQVSAIFGAKTDNNIGIAGINWNTKILVLSDVDKASEVIEAYEYVYNLRKKYNDTKGKEGAFIVVTNNSFGWNNLRPENLGMGIELCQMYDVLGSAGILSVGSGPNEPVDVDIVGDTPTNCTSDYFIGVTSTDERDEKSDDGGFGTTSIDLGAPGERVQSIKQTGEYGAVSGTSFAVPHVVGTIALMYALPCSQLASDALQSAPQTASFLKNIILTSADPVADLDGITLTGKRLNAFNAMASIQVYCGRTEGEKLDILRLYPNPSEGQLNIEYETPNYEEYQLLIYNALGQLVYEKRFLPPRFANPILQENLDNLSPGVYVVTLLRRDAHISRRFIIDRLTR